MSGEIHEALRKRTGSAHMRYDIKDFFEGWSMDGNIVEPEKLPPLSGLTTLADGTVIEPKTKRGSVLQEAITTINGERQDVYGAPENSFKLIGEYWSTYLRNRKSSFNVVDAVDVAVMMTLFKIAREANQHKRDNIVDAAGYLGIYADMQEAE